MADADRIALKLENLFPPPRYSVRIQRAEVTLEPSVHVISTRPFNQAELARLLRFAEREGLSLSVGGGGTKFHTATFSRP